MTDTRTWKARTGGLVLGLILSMTSVAWSNIARADEPPAPAAEAAPAPPPVLPPPPAEMPPPPPPLAAAPEAKTPTATETMPASRPDVLPPIDVGAWSRVGSVFQGSDPKKINDWHMNAAYVELHAGGKIHKKVGVTLNLNADMAGSGGASLMDGIIQFDAQDEFHVWAGHLLVPVDRSNASGPFFMIGWNYPGNFVGSPFSGAPKEGPYGRNNGAVIWGDISGGKLTYLAGAFDNGVGTSPLFSGRLRLALLDPEPGFWGNGSYFGDKDLLSIGVGAQYQKHGSTSNIAGVSTDKDWSDINFDVLFEKKIPGGGWFTVEGAYYHFNVNDSDVSVPAMAVMNVSDSYYALVAYASPVVGVGNIQPMLRFQGQKYKGLTGDGSKPWSLDAGLAYLIKGPALRVVATYTHTDMGTDSANMLQLGAQAIFF